jgi:hypothetical protein
MRQYSTDTVPRYDPAPGPAFNRTSKKGDYLLPPGAYLPTMAPGASPFDDPLPSTAHANAPTLGRTDSGNSLQATRDSSAGSAHTLTQDTRTPLVQTAQTLPPVQTPPRADSEQSALLSGYFEPDSTHSRTASSSSGSGIETVVVAPPPVSLTPVVENRAGIVEHSFTASVVAHPSTS